MQRLDYNFDCLQSSSKKAYCRWLVFHGTAYFLDFLEPPEFYFRKIMISRLISTISRLYFRGYFFNEIASNFKVMI